MQSLDKIMRCESEKDSKCYWIKKEIEHLSILHTTDAYVQNTIDKRCDYAVIMKHS